MKLSRNVALGFANSAFSAAVGIAVVPIYIQHIGIASYGIIGFFATTQALVQLLDIGLSTTMNREVARSGAAGSGRHLGNLLHTLSAFYWTTALLIAGSGLVVGPLLATVWLNPGSLSGDTVRTSVILLWFVIACRWPIGLYQGVLLGAHKLQLTSVVSIVMTAVGSLGAVLVLAHVAPTIEAFFIWQAVVGVSHALLMRRLAWREIGTSETRLDWSELRRVWKFTAGMSGVAVTGMLLMQTDKIVLSKLLTLEAFGQYMVATVISGGLYLILSPTFNLIFPRLSSLLLNPEHGELCNYYRRGTRALTAVLFPLATVLVVFAHDIIFLWTRNAALADASAPIVRLFLVGTTLNGVMHFPYALQLASGATRTPITINLFLLALMLPMTVALSVHYGAVGGAASWALLNLFYLLLGTWLTHRTLLPGMGARWLVQDVALPLAVTLVIVGTLCVWLSQSSLPRPLVLLLAVGLMTGFSMLLVNIERLGFAGRAKPLLPSLADIPLHLHHNISRASHDAAGTPKQS